MSTKKPKLRKIEYENRVFNKDWELKYFFVEQNKKPMCVICNTSIAVMKEHNIQRHYKTHSQQLT